MSKVAPVSRVGHQVDSQGGDVFRADNPPDRQTAAELVTALLQLVAEQRG
jgi:hypothetical protein